MLVDDDVVHEDTNRLNDQAIARAMQEDLDHFYELPATHSSFHIQPAPAFTGSRRTSRTSVAAAQSLAVALPNSSSINKLRTASSDPFHMQQQSHREECNEPPSVARIVSHPVIARHSRAHLSHAHSTSRTQSHLLQPQHPSLPSLYATSVSASWPSALSPPVALTAAAHSAAATYHTRSAFAASHCL